MKKIATTISLLVLILTILGGNVKAAEKIKSRT